MDWIIGANDNLSGVWSMDRVTQTNLGVPAYNAIDPCRQSYLRGFGFQYQTQIYNFSETHLFSPVLYDQSRDLASAYITRFESGR